MRKTAAVVMAVGALALAGCSGPAGQAAQSQSTTADASASSGAQEEVTIAMVASACLGLYPAYVAQEQGYFAEQGLKVNIEPVNGSAAVLQAILSGQAQVGTPGAAPLIFSASEGQDVQYFANTMPAGSFALIAEAGSGISSPEDFRGKTIGISTADGGEVAFVKAVLQEAGLQEGDYETLVVGEGGQAVAGFTRGDIDAFAASPDGVATLVTSGLDVAEVEGTRAPHLFGNGLAASASYISDNPETVEAFATAYGQAVEYGMENPEGVVEACSKYQPQEVEDPAFAQAMLDAFNRSQQPPTGAEFGYSDPEHWQRVVDDLIAAGELEEGSVNVDELYTNEFVEALNP